jgi:conjugative relaxase-like TrwC/TraI family protein
MLSISHALSPGKTQSYYREEYSAADKRYFSHDNQLQGVWHGRLASELGLTGTVNDQAFDRLALGQNPETAEQWIAHRDTVLTKAGKEAAHRAAWDLTMHASKSISLAALVGGDERIIHAHEAANRTALDAMERQAQARMGGNKPPFTTEKWIAASFLHDTARPVEIELATGEKVQYPAPHLHTHTVVFNLTAEITGQARSLQSKALFEAQSFGTAVYRAELAIRLKELGYDVTQNEKGAPEIQGFSKEYLAAESLRSAGIKERLEQLGLSGRRAEEIIAHQDRGKKLNLTKEELRALHQAHGQQFGNQAQQAVEEARRRGKATEVARTIGPSEAVSFAIRRLSEREAVFDHFQVARDALNYGQGHLRLKDVDANIMGRRTIHERDLGEGKDLLMVDHYRTYSPGARYTTPQMLAMERATISIVRNGIGASNPIAAGVTKEEISSARTPDGHRLNNAQKAAVWNVLTTQDRVIGLQGVAGSGKTTSLRLIRELAETHGYEARGLAPTSGATKALREAGVESETLQRHLRREPVEHEKPRLYFLDESSLSSTRHMHDFLVRIRHDDRVLLTGDTRQHQSIDAGRIFDQLQTAGMTTHHLNHIVRQQNNPELLAAVKHLADGNVRGALELFESQGRIHEVQHRRDRFAEIARDYAKSPETTLVVSADNQSRVEINQAIRHQLRLEGQLGPDRYSLPILVARQDLTKEDHKIASSYHAGDVVRYGRRNESIGFLMGDYSTVVGRDTVNNVVVVQRHSDGQEIRYDPSRVRGGQLYAQQERSFAAGERIQLTINWKEKGLANRQLGTIESLDVQGNVVVRMDERNRRVPWQIQSMRHLDYGYTMTSYSSQGATMDRVLIHVDTGDSRVRALNDKTMAYVAGSRGRNDLQLYTDNQADLESTLNRVTFKPTALSMEQIQQGRTRPASKAKQPEQSVETGIGVGIV